MANNCMVDARVTGKAKNIKKLIEMLSWKGQYKDDGLGRVFECCYDDYDFEVANDEDIIGINMFLDVAWSIQSAMRNNSSRNLETESKRLNLVVEAYSSEPGIGFQEHVLIDRGEVLIDECVDYEEYYVGDYESIDAYNEENGTEFTEDMVNENEDVCIGGFGEQYGLFKYFKKEHFEEV